MLGMLEQTRNIATDCPAAGACPWNSEAKPLHRLRAAGEVQPTHPIELRKFEK